MKNSSLPTDSPHGGGPMTDLRALHEAFAELAQRADAVEFAPSRFESAPTAAPAWPAAAAHRRRTRLLAPALAAAAVAVTVAGGVTLARVVADGAPGANRAAGPVVPTAPAAPAVPGAGSPSTSTGSTTATRTPPRTAAELADRARQILAGTATITVVDDDAAGGGPGSVTVSLPPASTTASGRDMPIPSAPVGVARPADPVSGGPAIRGVLTAAGQRGGYDLNVYTGAPGDQARCDADTECAITPTATGGSLAVSTWRSADIDGGVTRQVELVRADGLHVLIHLSNLADPKGAGPVLSAEPPLTTAQLVGFVSSALW